MRTVAVGRLSGVYAHTTRDLLILVFHATSDTRQPRPTASEDKVKEARWFAPDEALRQVTHEREHEALADALTDANAPIYRAYR